MELSDEMLTEISYVQISKYREKVMKNSGIRTNHISKVLAELKAHELVECINPEVKKGRLYRLTETGEEIVKNLE